MKILHIITALGNGGAEHTLYKICKYDKSNDHIVISFKGEGKYFSLLNEIGTKVYILKTNPITFFLKFFLLIKMIRFLNPDLVQTWLVHGDFLGGIAAKLAGIKNIVWNIRYSNLEFKSTNSIKPINIGTVHNANISCLRTSARNSPKKYNSKTTAIGIKNSR